MDEKKKEAWKKKKKARNERYKEKHRLQILLFESPCPFCGYDGENYWQKGTHASACPYYVAAGLEDRVEVLIPFLVDVVKQYMQAVIKKENADV